MRIDEVGPGLWWITHSLAKNAQNPDGLRKFKEHVEYLKTHFPCEVCRPHINTFFEKHRIDNYTGDMINGQDVGPFRLTWIMHSQVNERLKKPFFSFEKAYDVYFTHGSCKMDLCAGTIDTSKTYEKPEKGRKKFTLMRLNA